MLELYGLYLGVYAQAIHFDLLMRDFFAGLLQSREIMAWYSVTAMTGARGLQHLP